MAPGVNAVYEAMAEKWIQTPRNRPPEKKRRIRTLFRNIVGICTICVWIIFFLEKTHISEVWWQEESWVLSAILIICIGIWVFAQWVVQRILGGIIALVIAGIVALTTIYRQSQPEWIIQDTSIQIEKDATHQIDYTIKNRISDIYISTDTTKNVLSGNNKGSRHIFTNYTANESIDSVSLTEHMSRTLFDTTKNILTLALPQEAPIALHTQNFIGNQILQLSGGIYKNIVTHNMFGDITIDINTPTQQSLEVGISVGNAHIRIPDTIGVHLITQQYNGQMSLANGLQETTTGTSLLGRHKKSFTSLGYENAKKKITIYCFVAIGNITIERILWTGSIAPVVETTTTTGTNTTGDIATGTITGTGF